MMPDVIKYRFRFRRRTAAEWAATNEVLLPQEPGIEADTGMGKVGDDAGMPWNSLKYTLIGDIDLSGLAPGFIIKRNATNTGWVAAAESGGGGGGGGGGGSPFVDDGHLPFVVMQANFDGTRPIIGTNLVGSVFAQATFANASQLCSINADGLVIRGGLYTSASYVYDMPVGLAGTVDVWVKPSATTQGNILTTRPAGSATTGWLLRQEAGGKIIISDIGGSAATTATAVLSPGTWAFIRYIFTTTTCELWVNGTKVANFTRTAYGTGGGALTVGCSVGGSPTFPGTIASFRIVQGYAYPGASVPASHFF